MKNLLTLVMVAALAACAPPSQQFQLSPEAAEAFDKHRSFRSTDFKVFAVDPNGGAWGRVWGYRSVPGAVQEALRRCGTSAKNCRLYALGDEIVLAMTRENMAAKFADYRTRVHGNEWIEPAAKTLTTKQLEFYYSGSKLKVTKFHGTELYLRLSNNGTFVATRPRDDLTSRLNPEGVIRTLDRDGDGRISPNEYRRSREHFNRLDLNGDGYLVKQELQTLLTLTTPGGTDQGTWSADNDEFCVTYRRWYRGGTICRTIVKDGDTFKAYRNRLLVSRIVILGHAKE